MPGILTINMIAQHRVAFHLNLIARDNLLACASWNKCPGAFIVNPFLDQEEAHSKRSYQYSVHTRSWKNSTHCVVLAISWFYLHLYNLSILFDTYYSS